MLEAFITIYRLYLANLNNIHISQFNSALMHHNNFSDASNLIASALIWFLISIIFCLEI
jgi:hypothetical protein